MKDITNSAKDRKNWADFIREDYDKAAFLTAAKMGGEVGVSESTGGEICDGPWI